MTTELEYVIGSEAGFEVELRDDSDRLLDLSGASDGVFVLRDHVEGANLVSVTSGITFANGVISVPLSASDTSALSPGVYLGECKFVVTGTTHVTKPFRVVLVRSMAL